MFKQFTIIRKKTTMTVEEFRHDWKHVHGPLVAKIPGLKKYVQYHVHSELRSKDEVGGVESDADPIDGIAEMWFESEEAMKKSRETPEYQKVAENDPNLFEMTSHFVHPVIVDKTVEKV